MHFFKLTLLVLILLFLFSQSESADFSQCYASIANKNAKQPVTDQECSYCVEGMPSHPCDNDDLCVCVTTGQLPPLLPWQIRRNKLFEILLDKLKFQLPIGEIDTFGNNSNCGIFGAIAALTNYTYDNTYIGANGDYGFFQFDTKLKRYYLYFLDHFNKTDSTEMQIQYTSRLLNKFFNWQTIHASSPFNLWKTIRLYDMLNNRYYSTEQQADNFIQNFMTNPPTDSNGRRAAAKHCLFLVTKPYKPTEKPVKKPDIEVPDVTVTTVTETETKYPPFTIPVYPINGFLNRNQFNILFLALIINTFFNLIA